jgi:hypothetical protein
MGRAKLTINSRNDGAWSLRGWLLGRIAGLDVDEEVLGSDDPFGAEPTMADAMYAPVYARFVTYDVRLDPACATYHDTIMAWPATKEWVAAALDEPDDLEELDVEF